MNNSTAIKYIFFTMIRLLIGCTAVQYLNRIVLFKDDHSYNELMYFLGNSITSHR